MTRLSPLALYRLLVACATISTINYADLQFHTFQTFPSILQRSPQSGWAFLVAWLLSEVLSLASPAFVWLVVWIKKKEVFMQSSGQKAPDRAVPSTTNRTMIVLTLIAVLVTIEALASVGLRIWSTYTIIHSPVVGNHPALYAHAIGTGRLIEQALASLSGLAMALFVWIIREYFRRGLTGVRAGKP